MNMNVPSSSIDIARQHSKQMIRAKRKSQMKKNVTAMMFLAPALILYFVFMLYPMIDAVRYSLFDWNGASATMNFIGLQNYAQLTKDTIFLKSVGHNLLWVAISLLLMVIPTFILIAPFSLFSQDTNS